MGNICTAVGSRSVVLLTSVPLLNSNANCRKRVSVKVTNEADLQPFICLIIHINDSVRQGPTLSLHLSFVSSITKRHLGPFISQRSTSIPPSIRRANSGDGEE